MVTWGRAVAQWLSNSALELVIVASLATMAVPHLVGVASDNSGLTHVTPTVATAWAAIAVVCCVTLLWSTFDMRCVACHSAGVMLAGVLLAVHGIELVVMGGEPLTAVWCIAIGLPLIARGKAEGDLARKIGGWQWTSER